MVEAIKTHKIFFEKSCRVRDDVEKCDKVRQATDENMIPRMRIDYWINKVTDTHSEYVSVSTTTMITQTRLRVVLYIHFLFCRKELHQDLNFNMMDRCGNNAIGHMFQKQAVQNI
jgi:hypothetical protein